MAQGYLGANRITIRRLPLYLIVNPASQTSPLAMTACTMEHLHISQVLGILVVMLLAAKVSGYAGAACGAAGGAG